MAKDVEEIFHPYISSQKNICTRQYFSAQLLQAYIELKRVRKEIYKGQTATEILAEKTVQVARHVRAIFHLTTNSELNYVSTLKLLSSVVAGLHSA